MSYIRDLQNKYDHALDRIYDLYKIGRERELKIENALELARDELQRIKVCPGANGEIIGLCKRGLEMTKI